MSAGKRLARLAARQAAGATNPNYWWTSATIAIAVAALLATACVPPAEEGSNADKDPDGPYTQAELWDLYADDRDPNAPCPDALGRHPALWREARKRHPRAVHGVTFVLGTGYTSGLVYALEDFDALDLSMVYAVGRTPTKLYGIARRADCLLIAVCTTDQFKSCDYSGALVACQQARELLQQATEEAR